MTFLARLALILCLLPGVAAARASPFRAVLVGGDKDLPVFDNATAAMRRLLIARGIAPDDIQRLSATPAVIAQDKLPPSGEKNVLDAIRGLHPTQGQGCLVFVTSHGVPGDGLMLALNDEFLTPAALDKALVQGCGDAPTIVIASGCYSGGFARAPMARTNRIILTAARANRPSFGCDAGREFTVYDLCLLRTLEEARTWRDVHANVRACVSQAERRFDFPASFPQASFGKAVATLAVPVRP